MISKVNIYLNSPSINYKREQNIGQYHPISYNNIPVQFIGSQGEGLVCKCSLHQVHFSELKSHYQRNGSKQDPNMIQIVQFGNEEKHHWPPPPATHLGLNRPIAALSPEKLESCWAGLPRLMSIPLGQCVALCLSL